MNSKEKSKYYFDRHSHTKLNKNGYWNKDYRITGQIIKQRKIQVLLDVGCGNGAFLKKCIK